MSEVIAGVEIPDSVLAREATELVREATSPLLYDHSRRVFLWGALRGREQGIDYDPELLYVAAMFHDLGLTERFRRTDQRFEIDGADEARRFLHAHGITGEPADRVWASIALHTTQEIPLHMSAEIALVNRGVGLDVVGIGYDAVSDEQRAAVVAAHPARTSRTASSPPSPRASRTAPRPRSATSRRMCWPTSYPASCGATSSRRSRTRTGRSEDQGLERAGVEIKGSNRPA